mgnify:CR=1 FL=1
MQFHAGSVILHGMWNEPYLETCCRSALHRLFLAGADGRPCGLKDDPCLERLERMGLARRNAGERFVATDAGLARHAREVMQPKNKHGPARA